MELEFITRLGEQGFIELINFCIEKQNKRYQEEGISTQIFPIDGVVIHNELERKDLNGNYYIWVCSFYGERALSSYTIKDFYMNVDNIGLYGRSTAINYTTDMREFMAKLFGKEYIKALFQYQTSEAEKEMNRLLDCLSKEKKI